ncbi:MAG TPA: OB-fold nucleic acid binding domain-containing protein, partial [Pirellulales bacterium]
LGAGGAVGLAQLSQGQEQGGPAEARLLKEEAMTLKGTVKELLKNDHDDVDGFTLADGQEIHFPPHNGPAVLKLVKPGEQISVLGAKKTRPKGEVVFEAEQIDVGGETLAIDRPAPPPHGPKGKKNETPMNANGAVAEFVENPHGDVDGFTLADGTEVKVPPHLAGELPKLFKQGSEVKIVGRRHVTPHGDVHLHADRITAVASGETWERPEEPAGPKHGPKHGPHADAGPTNADLMKELREIRRLLESSPRS